MAEASAIAAQMERVAAAKAEATFKNNNQPNMTEQSESGPPAHTTIGTADARAGTAGKGQLPTPPSGTTGPMNHVQGEGQRQDIADEDALLESSTLPGNKVFMDQYHEDESNSKKTKTTNTGKGKRQP